MNKHFASIEVLKNEVNKKTEGVIKKTYCNYKGEVSLRTLYPIKIEFKYSEYHSKEKEKVWILIAYDLDKNDLRDFSLNDFLDN